MAGGLTISTLNDSTGVLATQNGMSGIAKAWVKFNGSTASINGSFNVSSITKNGTGDWTVNLTTAMPNSNFSSVASTGDAAMAGSAYANQITNCGRQTTTSFRILNTSGNVVYDSTQVSAIAIGS